MSTTPTFAQILAAGQSGPEAGAGGLPNSPPSQEPWNEDKMLAADLADAAETFKAFGCTDNIFRSVYPLSPVSMLRDYSELCKYLLSKEDPRHVILIHFQASYGSVSKRTIHQHFMKALGDGSDVYIAHFDRYQANVIISVSLSSEFNSSFQAYASSVSKKPDAGLLETFMHSFVLQNWRMHAETEVSFGRIHPIVSVFKGRVEHQNGGLALLHCFAMTTVFKQLSRSERNNFTSHRLIGSPIFNAYIISLARPILRNLMVIRLFNIIDNPPSLCLTHYETSVILHSSSLFTGFPPSWAPAPDTFSLSNRTFYRFFALYVKTETAQDKASYSTRGSAGSTEWADKRKDAVLLHAHVGPYLLVLVERSRYEWLGYDFPNLLLDVPAMTQLFTYPIMTDGEFWTISRAIMEAAINAGGQGQAKIFRKTISEDFRNFSTDIERQVQSKSVVFDRIHIPKMLDLFPRTIPVKDIHSLCDSWAASLMRSLGDPASIGFAHKALPAFKFKSENEGESFPPIFTTYGGLTPRRALAVARTVTKNLDAATASKEVLKVIWDKLFIRDKDNQVLVRMAEISDSIRDQVAFVTHCGFVSNPRAMEFIHEIDVSPLVGILLRSKVYDLRGNNTSLDKLLQPDEYIARNLSYHARDPLYPSDLGSAIGYGLSRETQDFFAAVATRGLAPDPCPFVFTSCYFWSKRHPMFRKDHVNALLSKPLYAGSPPVLLRMFLSLYATRGLRSPSEEKQLDMSRFAYSLLYPQNYATRIKADEIRYILYNLQLIGGEANEPKLTTKHQKLLDVMCLSQCVVYFNSISDRLQYAHDEFGSARDLASAVASGATAVGAGAGGAGAGGAGAGGGLAASVATACAIAASADAAAGAAADQALAHLMLARAIQASTAVERQEVESAARTSPAGSGKTVAVQATSVPVISGKNALTDFSLTSKEQAPSKSHLAGLPIFSAALDSHGGAGGTVHPIAGVGGLNLAGFSGRMALGTKSDSRYEAVEGLLRTIEQKLAAIGEILGPLRVTNDQMKAQWGPILNQTVWLPGGVRCMVDPILAQGLRGGLVSIQTHVEYVQTLSLQALHAIKDIVRDDSNVGELYMKTWMRPNAETQALYPVGQNVAFHIEQIHTGLERVELLCKASMDTVTTAIAQMPNTKQCPRLAFTPIRETLQAVITTMAEVYEAVGVNGMLAHAHRLRVMLATLVRSRVMGETNIFSPSEASTGSGKRGREEGEASTGTGKRAREEGEASTGTGKRAREEGGGDEPAEGGHQRGEGGSAP